jgi:hypothetical protein
VDAAPCIIRPAVESDADFVRSTWLKSASETFIGRSIVPPVYFARWAPLIDGALQRSTVLVACDEEMPGVLLGWLAYELIPTAKGIKYPLCLHYLLTKHGFERAGVSRALFEASPLHGKPFYFSAKTPAGHAILPKVEPRPTYDPTLFFRRPE